MWNKRRLGKQAIIEVQFNWIFVLIAGFVLFVFIISLVMSQKNNATNTFDIAQMNILAASISSAQQLTNSYDQLSVADTSLEFRCDQGTGKSSFKTTGASTSIDMPLDIVFTTRTLTGKYYQLWTSDFTMPFVVTRFIYITTPKNAVFVYNTSASPYAKQFFSELPDNVTKMYVSSVSEIDSRKPSFSRVKIVCFNHNCPPAAAEDYIDFSVGIPNILYSYGNITFHKAPGTNQLSQYLNKASLFGAVFSENRDYYECQMSRAMMQFQVKRAMQHARFKLMESVLNSTNFECINVMATPEARLLDMENLTLANASLIYRYSRDIDLANNDLFYYRCPEVR